MNDKLDKINEFLDEEETTEMNDFGNPNTINPKVLVVIIAAIIIAVMAAFIGFTLMSDKMDQTKKDTIDEMYAIETECLENADQISKEMIDELNDIRDYLTDVEESIANNESLLNEYSDTSENGYSELGVTYKNSTNKITYEFGQISG